MKTFNTLKTCLRRSTRTARRVFAMIFGIVEILFPKSISTLNNSNPNGSHKSGTDKADKGGTFYSGTSIGARKGAFDASADPDQAMASLWRHYLENANSPDKPYTFGLVLDPELHDKNGAAMIRALLPYQDDKIKDAIWILKYNSAKKHAIPFAHIIYDELIGMITDKWPIVGYGDPIPLIYIPSSTYASGRKKFDHMKGLSQYIGKRLDPSQHFLKTYPDAVQISKRYLRARSQHQGTRGQRRLWAQDRFVISQDFIKKIRDHMSDGLAKRPIGGPPTIFCIDDVVTTSSTFNSLARAIKVHIPEARIVCLALCH